MWNNEYHSSISFDLFIILCIGVYFQQFKQYNSPIQLEN